MNSNKSILSIEELNSVIEVAIKETFSKFMRTQVSCEELELTVRDSLKRDISGVVGLVRDDSIEGTFSINFEYETLTPLLCQFFKKEVTTTDKMTSESVAELTNMIYGIIKEYLNNHDYGYQMCLPVVTVGNCHEVFSSVRGERSLFKVDSPLGSFWCEMNLHKIGIDTLLAA